VQEEYIVAFTKVFTMKHLDDCCQNDSRYQVMGWRHGSNSIVLDLQTQSPEFKPQYPLLTPQRKGHQVSLNASIVVRHLTHVLGE
jgi:hypothetical protein